MTHANIPYELNIPTHSDKCPLLIFKLKQLSSSIIL